MPSSMNSSRISSPQSHINSPRINGFSSSRIAGVSEVRLYVNQSCCMNVKGKELSNVIYYLDSKMFSLSYYPIFLKFMSCTLTPHPLRAMTRSTPNTPPSRHLLVPAPPLSVLTPRSARCPPTKRPSLRWFWIAMRSWSWAMGRWWKSWGITTRNSRSVDNL